MHVVLSSAPSGELELQTLKRTLKPFSMLTTIPGNSIPQGRESIIQGLVAAFNGTKMKFPPDLVCWKKCYSRESAEKT